jgi:hypothetical protein
MVEAGEQGGFLAEITGQSDDLDVEWESGQRPRNVGCSIAAAVIDIYCLKPQFAFGVQITRDLRDPLMQSREAFGLVKERHHDR